MARTLTYRPSDVFQVGIVYGLGLRLTLSQKAQTVSAATIVEPHAVTDPFEELFGRYDNDPSWEDFPRWLKEYRAKQRDLATQE